MRVSLFVLLVAATCFVAAESARNHIFKKSMRHNVQTHKKRVEQGSLDEILGELMNEFKRKVDQTKPPKPPKVETDCEQTCDFCYEADSSEEECVVSDKTKCPAPPAEVTGFECFEIGTKWIGYSCKPDSSDSTEMECKPLPKPKPEKRGRRGGNWKPKPKRLPKVIRDADCPDGFSILESSTASTEDECVYHGIGCSNAPVDYTFEGEELCLDIDKPKNITYDCGATECKPVRRIPETVSTDCPTCPNYCVLSEDHATTAEMEEECVEEDPGECPEPQNGLPSDVVCLDVGRPALYRCDETTNECDKVKKSDFMRSTRRAIDLLFNKMTNAEKRELLRDIKKRYGYYY